MLYQHGRFREQISRRLFNQNKILTFLGVFVLSHYKRSKPVVTQYKWSSALFSCISNADSIQETEVGPKTLELANLASHLNLKSDTPSRGTDLHDTVLHDSNGVCSDRYSRYLVLEVYRREVMDGGAADAASRALTEKVLRMFDEEKSQERYCYLREDWEMTEVEPGDIVHVTGW